jgi:N-ethylmaleimide reductase
MVNGGYTAGSGNAAIVNGDADTIAFGKLYIANPDLPERFRLGTPLNSPDETTFYGGGEKGYIDYPGL